MITVDLNGDNKCMDGFYRKKAVSHEKIKPKDFLAFPIPQNPMWDSDDFELNGPIMIWSFGPDQKINATVTAKDKENKDNILSWAAIMQTAPTSSAECGVRNAECRRRAIFRLSTLNPSTLS